MHLASGSVENYTSCQQVAKDLLLTMHLVKKKHKNTVHHANMEISVDLLIMQYLCQNVRFTGSSVPRFQRNGHPESGNVVLMPTGLDECVGNTYDT
ncbi:hypothetical protein CEXT_561001 [Caerostris extrusa]|uniref:Uncharacterized protein n=1 Tax=Caerostris extrusa TaxID=172846 RepID=A0AAV4NQ82_CAEEX|nr:hypothetical protein CEXT_561001 [Caerostris extrusa]